MIAVDGPPIEWNGGSAPVVAVKKAEKTDNSGLIKRIAALEAENRDLRTANQELRAALAVTAPVTQPGNAVTSGNAPASDVGNALPSRHALKQAAYRARKAASRG